MSNTKIVRFTYERETKNKVRFSEVGDEPVVGKLYIDKGLLESWGSPRDISIEIRADG